MDSTIFWTIFWTIIWAILQGGGTHLVLREGWVQSTNTEGGVGEECYNSGMGGRCL